MNTQDHLFLVERGDTVKVMRSVANMIEQDLLLLGDIGAVRYNGVEEGRYNFTVVNGERPISIPSERLYVENHRLSISNGPDGGTIYE